MTTWEDFSDLGLEMQQTCDTKAECLLLVEKYMKQAAENDAGEDL
jgi:hypothetical protein